MGMGEPGKGAGVAFLERVVGRLHQRGAAGAKAAEGRGEHKEFNLEELGSRQLTTWTTRAHLHLSRTPLIDSSAEPLSHYLSPLKTMKIKISPG